MFAAIVVGGPPLALNPLVILLGFGGGVAAAVAIAALFSRRWSRR